MVDLGDFVWEVQKHEIAGQHGLAHLERYRRARQRGDDGAIPTETLAFLDLLAEAFLDAADSSTKEIREVVSNPTLGLVHPGGRETGRPKRSPSDEHLYGVFRWTKESWAALYRQRLIDSGVPMKEAERLTLDEFVLDAIDLTRSVGKFEEVVRRKLDQEAMLQQWADANPDTLGLAELERDLVARCRSISSTTPRVNIVLRGAQDDQEKLVVTFPPVKLSLRKRLVSLEDYADGLDVAAICVADTKGLTTIEARGVLQTWSDVDACEFAKQALQHLKSTCQDEK